MRKQAFVVAALIGMGVFARCASGARVEDSLAALHAKPNPGSRFTFIAVADMHSAQSPIRTEALRMTMKEISLLRPELVVAAGDMIHGAALDTLMHEWEESLSDAALSAAPFFPAAGNHDVAGPETEAIWTRVNGPLHYSFDHGNCHFVILNSMEKGGPWGSQPLEWLKADLDASRAENVFVFLHHPLWESDPERWHTVHEVLRAHPVRIVFAGHWHNYSRFDPVDGIEYVVLPSAGQTYAVGADNVATGDIGGYVIVQVDGARVSYVVVRAGNIFPPDVSLQRDVTERERVALECVQAPVIDFAFGERLDAACKVVVKNPYSKPMSSSIAWQVPNDNWQVEPRARDYQVPAGKEASLEFRVRASRPSAVMYPTPTFRTKYRYGPQQEKSVTVEERIELRPSFPVARVRRPIVVDGKPDEWRDVPTMPLQYAMRISPTETDNLSAKAQFQWDEGYLYLAVTVRDNVFYQPYSEDGVWQADNLQMFFDPKDDGNDRGHHEDDYEYGMTLTAKGPQVWVWRDPSRYEGLAPDISLAVRRSGTFTIYEAAIPAARLAPEKLVAGRSIGYNLAVNDLDGPVGGKRHWWVELLPGAGGGNPPFPLVRLVLK